jgi:hypothetical protein
MKRKVVTSTFALVFSVTATFATSWAMAIPKESGQVGGA